MKELKRLTLWRKAHACHLLPATCRLLVVAGLAVAWVGLPGCGGGGGGATITGVVVESGSSPPVYIGGAFVVIGGKTALSKDDGTFTVRDIPKQQTQPITVSKTGYRTFDQGDLPLNVQQPFQVSLESVANDTFGTVKGKLLDDKSGAGIGRAQVQVGSLFGGEVLQSFSGHTADDGSFQISGVPTGDARVEVSLTGYSPSSQDILVVSGDATPELIIRLVKEETLVPVSGSVFDVEERTPISAATVAVEGQQQTTDASGAFSFSAVKSGTRVFTVTADAYQTAQRTVQVQPGMQPLRIGMARLGAGPPPPPHTLTGTVTLADQSDASGITVEAVEESSGLAMDTSATDENGLYYLWVPAGAYLLTASKSGYQSASQQITILPSEVGTLDFMLSRARH